MCGISGIRRSLKMNSVSPIQPKNICDPDLDQNQSFSIRYRSNKSLHGVNSIRQNSVHMSSDKLFGSVGSGKSSVSSTKSSPFLTIQWPVFDSLFYSPSMKRMDEEDIIFARKYGEAPMSMHAWQNITQLSEEKNQQRKCNENFEIDEKMSVNEISQAPTRYIRFDPSVERINAIHGTTTRI
jgi:hypothetical protein